MDGTDASGGDPDDLEHIALPVQFATGRDAFVYFDNDASIRVPEAALD